MTAINSIHNQTALKKAAIRSTNRADMRWWNQPSQKVAQKAHEPTSENTIKNRHTGRTNYNPRVTAFMPLEA